MKQSIALAVVLAAAAGVQWLAWSEQQQCEKIGGVYVRALFWFECVKK